jgi:signal transduction histidine kinase
VEPELRSAGIVFDWQVQEVPQLDWLGPVNALHVLRIFQEALSNIAGHAQATSIRVGCRAERSGVLIEMSDNGVGFDIRRKDHGRGLKNMSSRAEALAGEFSMRSVEGEGTTFSLWLPLTKQEDRNWP